MNKLLSIIFIFILVALTVPADAYYFWFDDTGTETVAANCRTETATPPGGSTSGYCAPTASRAVNIAVNAGDTVYYRAGTYNATSDSVGYIQTETNSGTAEAHITYSAWNGETVIIHGDNASAVGIRLTNYRKDEGRSYVRITGLIFENMSQNAVLMYGASHNEISYCTFKSTRDTYNDIQASGTVTETTTDGKTIKYADSDTKATVTYSASALINTTDMSMCMLNSTAPVCADGTCTRTCLPSGAYYDVLMFGGDNQFQSGDGYRITPIATNGGIYISNNSIHNWIHHNVIYGTGQFELKDQGVNVEIGGGGSSSDGSNYTTVEYNHIYHGGHHVLGVNGTKYSVVRNNYIHNESWYDGSTHTSNGCGGTNDPCGYRSLSATSDNGYGGWVLYENNVIGYGAQYGAPHLGNIGSSGSGATLGTSNNIFRYNDLVGNAIMGARIGSSFPTGADYNHVYNNTFYHNGYGADDEATALDDYRSGLEFYTDGTVGSKIKNNLFYDHWCQSNYNTGTRYYPALTTSFPDHITTLLANNEVTNNYVNTTTNYISSKSIIDEKANPLFISSTLPADSSEIIAAWSSYAVSSPNLSLSDGSNAINFGTYLTQANGADTNSVTLVVDDASYFQDGTWGSDLAIAYNGTGDYVYEADWICVDTVANCVQIDSINYGTNTITLSTALTWADDAPVWLYKKSDGTRVLYGDAPDYGAHEYGGLAAGYFSCQQGTCNKFLQ